MLSIISKRYDSLDPIEPITIKAQVLRQSLWLSQVSWDEIIPAYSERRWTSYVNEKSDIERKQINRHIVRKKPVSVEKHTISDASESSYDCCCCLVFRDSGGSIHSHLLCAKSRVAPVKWIPLPRLELWGS